MFDGAEIQKTLEAYAESGMKKNTAAKKLFISAVGLEYRLQRIQKLTGLNPKVFGDLAELLKQYEKEENGAVVVK